MKFSSHLKNFFSKKNVCFHKKGSFEMVPFIFLLLCISSFLIWPFLFCYFANLTIEHIGRIDETSYNSNWYEFPNEIKKYLILIIARSQKPIHFNGLGMFHCTLEAFGKVSSLTRKSFINILK